MGEHKMRKGFLCLSLLFLSGFVFQFAQAQDFPTKPITLVIPMGAGGSHDLTARAVTSVAGGVRGS